MCGIVGIITKNSFGFSKQNTDEFTQMLWANSVRGWDSSGIFLANKYGNLEWMKSKYTPATLMGSDKYKLMLDKAFKSGQILVGHNRQATRGEVSDENSHPFVEDNICLVHNGTLSNHKDLADTEVDSHAVAKAFQSRGHIEVIEKIDGAFALVWYDAKEKKLHLARNNTRPLNLIETNTAWYISSEVGLVTWILGRQSSPIKVLQVLELSPGKCYTFEIGNTEKPTVQDIKLYSPKSDPHKEVFRGGEETKKMIISRGVDVCKKILGKSKRKISVGDSVLFNLEDYVDLDNNEDYDGVLWGSLNSDSQIKIRAYFRNDDWKKFSESSLISGEVDKIFYSGGVATNLWITPGSLKMAWTLKSTTNLEITEGDWEDMPHKCKKCGDAVEYWDVEECHITKKRLDKWKIFCPKCTLELDRRLFLKANHHAN